MKTTNLLSLVGSEWFMTDKDSWRRSRSGIICMGICDYRGATCEKQDLLCVAEGDAEVCDECDINGDAEDGNTRSLYYFM